MLTSSWRPLRVGLLFSGIVCTLTPGCGFTPSSRGGQGSPSDLPPGTTLALAEDRNADSTTQDPLGESVRATAYLDQGWSAADSERFYFTSQGSQIVPYDWFLALEQPDSDQLFRDPRNMLRFRYLSQRPSPMNPDGLPVGFARDVGAGRAWLGFTCAACHTAEVHYKEIAYRIDGGPSLADTTGMLRSLARALRQTRDQKDRFERFAARVLRGQDSAAARAALKDQLTVMIDRRDGYNVRNFPPGEVAGNGRIDAFGAILNEIFHLAVPTGEAASATANTQPADAPVSLPFLWDTPQHDIIQWNGAARNSPPIIGPLGRNVGEVLGVFGGLEIPDHPSLLGYRSTVQVQNLLKMEEWVTKLWSPQWPAAFPAIDARKRDQGRALYQRHCLECHDTINRTDPNRRIVARMRSTGTDPLMALNFQNRRGRAGKFEGGFSRFFPLIRDSHKIGPQAQGVEVLGNAVIGTIVGSAFPAPKDELSAIEFAQRPPSPPSLERTVPEGPPYKGRPLNGIWATAPYLHNGSVPTLHDLLLPAAQRPRHFSVGSRVFDPDKVGFRTDAKGFFTFRTVDNSNQVIPGNSNGGHEYGTALGEEERRQLLEYLKSL